MEDDYALFNARQAAEVHRQVRQFASKAITPGMSMTEVANIIEDRVRMLIGDEEEINGGIAFPTGLSLNEVAAHYTPNAGGKLVFDRSDVLKVDIGVHVQGRIIDSAFTLNFEPTHQPLLDAVRSATNASIRASGIDARLGEIGAAIQEVMESHEYEVAGKLKQVTSIRNLCGHSINLYSIHGEKTLPIVATEESTKMCEGESYAIETFGSTGMGMIRESGECSHYSRNKGAARGLRLDSAKRLLKAIDGKFGTLPFCRRYLDRVEENHYLLGLRHLVEAGIVEPYPPLTDIQGCHMAQFDHTLFLSETRKEVLNHGDDY